MTVTAKINPARVKIGFPNTTVTASTGLPVSVYMVGGGSMPLGGNDGDIIIKRSSADFDAEWVAPATSVEQDNTLPITAGAVYTEVGNINALLATI